MEYLSIPSDVQVFELKECVDGLFNSTPKKSLENKRSQNNQRRKSEKVESEQTSPYL